MPEGFFSHKLPRSLLLYPTHFPAPSLYNQNVNRKKHLPLFDRMSTKLRLGAFFLIKIEEAQKETKEREISPNKIIRRSLFQVHLFSFTTYIKDKEEIPSQIMCKIPSRCPLLLILI